MRHHALAQKGRAGGGGLIPKIDRPGEASVLQNKKIPWFVIFSTFYVFPPAITSTTAHWKWKDADFPSVSSPTKKAGLELANNWEISVAP